MRFKTVYNIRYTEGITRQTGFSSWSKVDKFKIDNQAENTSKSYIIDLLLKEVDSHNTIHPDYKESSLVECIFLDTIVIILNPSNLTIIGALGLNGSNCNKPKIDQV